MDSGTPKRIDPVWANWSHPLAAQQRTQCVYDNVEHMFSITEAAEPNAESRRGNTSISAQTHSDARFLCRLLCQLWPPSAQSPPSMPMTHKLDNFPEHPVECTAQKHAK